MENNAKPADMVIRKIFDMKMKQGHEMKKVHVDERDFLRTFYFLKGNRVFVIDITTKKLEELEFTKGKEIVYIGSSQNNDHLIIVLKSGVI